MSFNRKCLACNDDNDSATAAIKVLKGLNDFRKTGEFCDVTLVVGGGKFPAHRSVLASFSPYFKAMFLGEFTESRQSEVELKDIEAPVMAVILNHIYGSEMEVTETNVFQLLGASHLIQATPIIEFCIQFIKSHMKVDNCVTSLAYAELYGIQKLKDRAHKFIIGHLPTVAETEPFLQLSYDNLIEIIKKDDYCKSEEKAVKSVIRWVRYKEEERKPRLLEALKHIRFEELSAAFLHDHVEKEEMIQSSPDCMKLVHQAMWCLLLPHRAEEVAPMIKRRRAYKDNDYSYDYGYDYESDD